jgi:hypothetical protein
VRGSFQGRRAQAQESNKQQPLLILAAIVVIYIVLGILYESLVHPITVLSTLPSAGVGAVLALLMFKMEFSIIALIGVFLLIGIVKKNAILIIDFALEAERARGLSATEAVREACLLRFRPILMTTLAAALGALPLAIGFGEGSELRQPLGIAIIGGLIASQLLTLLTTPVVYVYWTSCAAPAARRARTGAPSPRTRSPIHPSMTRTMRTTPSCALHHPLAAAPGERLRRRPGLPAPERARAGRLQGSCRDGCRRRPPTLERGPWWTLFKRPAAERAGRQRRGLEPERGGGGGRLCPGARAGGGAARLAVPDREPDRIGHALGHGGGRRRRRPERQYHRRARALPPEYRLSLGGSWEPDVWGRLRAGVTAASASAQASAADLAAARLSAQGELATNYFSAARDRRPARAAGDHHRRLPARADRSRRTASTPASCRIRTCCRPRPSWPTRRATTWAWPPARPARTCDRGPGRQGAGRLRARRRRRSGR